ncbi:unnamed protein product [Prunus armeniaca]
MGANRMFSLHTQTQHRNQTCFSAKEQDSTCLWHYRYGDLNFNGLKTLLQKNMVTCLPEFQSPSEICEECILGKQHRDSFPKGGTWRATQALQLVHSNICGLINIK